MPLVALGVWDEFLTAGHLPAAGNHAYWGEDTGRHKDFLCNPYGDGWHIDRSRFTSCCSELLKLPERSCIGESEELKWRTQPNNGG